MKLIKLTESHYIIVDDSEIKQGDWVYDSKDKVIRFVKQYLPDKWIKKITHSTQPLEVKITDEGIHLPDWSKVKALSSRVVKELIGEVNVEKHWEYFRIKNPNTVGGFKEQYISFLYGYNQALEDNKEKKYTEEDMKNALFYALNHPKEDGVISITRDSIVRKSIQSLQPKTEWEVEIIDGKLKLK